MLGFSKVLDWFGRASAEQRQEVERLRAQANHFAQRLEAHYEAAGTSSENENHWANARGLAADAAASPQARKTIRDRARYEDANNSLCRGVVDTFVDSVYGRGPILNVETGVEAANESIERRFAEWVEERGIGERFRLAYRDDVVAGEGLCLKINRDLRSYSSDEPTLDLMDLECDRLSDPWDSQSDPLLRDGVRLDRAHRPKAYYLLDRHPGDTTSFQDALAGQWYRADRVVHLVRKHRPEQTRGVSALVAALPMFANFRRFLYATIAAAETAASISAVLKTTSPEIINGARESTSQGVANTPFDLLDIHHRTLMTLPEGWEIQQFASQHPNSTLEMFYRVVVAEIGRSLGMPYNVTAADSSDHNYASGRLDHQFWERVAQREQQRLAWHWKYDVLRDWFREAKTIPGYLSGGAHDVDFRDLNAEFLWDQLGHADPVKEAEAQKLRLELNTTTLKDELARERKDWRRVLRQRGEEKKLAISEGAEVDPIAMAEAEAKAKAPAAAPAPKKAPVKKAPAK